LTQQNANSELTTAEIEAFRRELPIVERWAYFNHCVTSPIPERSRKAVERTLARQSQRGTLCIPSFLKTLADGHEQIARLIHCRHEDVAFTANTTAGLALVANGLPWQPGDNVVLADIEYPGNVYPWWARERDGVELRWVKSVEGRTAFDDYAAAIDEHTRVLAASFVQFSSGFRNDLQRLGELCARRDILFVVDAIQGLGALELDVQACNISVMAFEGRKWLLGPFGVGVLYCHPDVLDRIGGPNAGAFSVVEPEPFLQYDFRLKPNAGRFESGGMNFAGIRGLSTSVGLLLETGPQRIEARVRKLTDHLCDGLSRRGYAVYSSREAGEWSGIVSFDAGNDGKATVARLKDRGVLVSFREGRIRVGPHFYNTFDEINQLLDALP